VLEHVKLIENDLGVRERGADRGEIGPMHIGADRGDRAALPTGQVLGQQRRGGRFASVLTHRSADAIVE
jgi:hypothetical protein